jgi:hypothetical protein
MIISERIISKENGTEYYNINFKVFSPNDITAKQYEEIETMIYEKLKQIEDEKRIQNVNR